MVAAPKKKKSTMELVATELHAGGKFGGGGYKVSSGLHGVGSSVVNALSEHLEAKVRKEYVAFELAEPTEIVQEYNNNGEALMPHVPDKEHDDRIMAWAGVMDLVKRSPKGNMVFRTFVPKRTGGYALVR